MYFSGPDLICKVDQRVLEKGLSAQKKKKKKKSRLGTLFKLTPVDGKLVEDPRNFAQSPGIITFIRDTGAT